jgi:hypothetical protein
LLLEDADFYRIIKIGHVLRFGVYPAVADGNAFEGNVGNGGEKGIGYGKGK